jgi:predicted amidophosphoribosyltransferase
LQRFLNILAKQGNIGSRLAEKSRGIVNDIVAQRVENILGLPRLTVLARHPGTTRESTYEELRSQFYVTPHRLDITGLKLLLLEDIWTRGRTIPICAEHLKSAGATDVYAIALAKTEG